MKRIIYKITNLINNKIYIGQTKNFEQRVKAHCKANRQRPTLISKTIQKYGKENFAFEILYKVDESEIDQLEIQTIQKFDCICPKGYNLSLGGDTIRQHSEETKEKIRKTKTGRKNSEESKRKLSETWKKQGVWNKGLKMSEEYIKKNCGKTKGKVSPLRGRKMSDEQRNKMSVIQKQYFKEHPEALIRLSMASKGRPSPKKGIPLSDETKKKLSISKTGQKHTEESKKKMSLSHMGHPSYTKGRKSTEEENKKRSESMKRAYQTHPEIKEKKSRSMKLAYAKNPQLLQKRSERMKAFYASMTEQQKRDFFKNRVNKNKNKIGE